MHSVSKKIISLFVLSALFGYGAIVAFAGPYAPGETLNPVAYDPAGCSGPLDADCYVTGGGATATNGLSLIGSDIGLGGTLVQDTVVDVDAYNYEIVIGNITDGYYDDYPAFGPGFPVTVKTLDDTAGGLLQEVWFEDGPGKPTVEWHADDSTTGEGSFVEFNPFNFSASWANGAAQEGNGIQVASSGITFSSSIGGSSNSYIFPRTDGGAGEVLTTDGLGQLSWTAGGGGGSSVFAVASNVTSNTGTGSDMTTDDFVFGHDALDHTSDPFLPMTRFLFDKSKGAFRAGMTSFDAWDNANRGDYSIGLGADVVASGNSSIALGKETTASGNSAISMGLANTASGLASVAMGNGSRAFSGSEIAVGSNNTLYTPPSSTGFSSEDRSFVVGNGSSGGSRSDAFTILKNGQTGIGIDNFELNTNGEIFQIGDGGTNVIGYVDSTTGAYVDVSDRRAKENIESIQYGLNEILQLEPKQYDFIRNGQRAIGLIAQDVEGVIPEIVSGSEENGYGIAYASLTPVLVAAIQDLDAKIINLQLGEPTGLEIFERVTDSVVSFAKSIFAPKVSTRELCIEDEQGTTCITRSQLDSVLESLNASDDDSESQHEMQNENEDSASNTETIETEEQEQIGSEKPAEDEVTETNTPETSEEDIVLETPADSEVDTAVVGVDEETDQVSQ